MMRDRMSVPPPGGKGATRRMGFDGYVSPDHALGSVVETTATAAAAAVISIFIWSSSSAALRYLSAAYVTPAVSNTPSV